MKPLLIAALFFGLVGCGITDKREVRRKIMDDFDRIEAIANYHLGARNMDSCLYYLGQMNYNIRLRKMFK